MKLNTLVIGYLPIEGTAVDPKHIWEMQSLPFGDGKCMVVMNNLFKVGIRFEGYPTEENQGYMISNNNDFRYLASVNPKMTEKNELIYSDGWICSMDLKSSINDYDTLEMFPTPSSYSPSIALTTTEKSETLISICINTDAYQLIKYSSYERSTIKTTMHLKETVPGRRNSAVGCIVGFRENELAPEYDDPIFRLVLKSRSTGELYDLNIYSDNNGEITVAKIPVDMDAIKSVNARLRRRRTNTEASDNFRAESRDIETSLVLVPEHNDIPLRLSNRADKYSCVIEVPDDLILTNDDNKLIKYLSEKLPKDKKGRFKACTLVGRLLLPLEVVQHFRWLYVFRYDGDNVITCIKSP
nr:MAG TPA: hypothetical protein [Caudoviricetes sp.]